MTLGQFQNEVEFLNLSIEQTCLEFEQKYPGFIHEIRLIRAGSKIGDKLAGVDCLVLVESNVRKQMFKESASSEYGVENDA